MTKEMNCIYVVVREIPVYRENIYGTGYNAGDRDEYIACFKNFEDAYLYAQTNKNFKVLKEKVHK